MRVRRGFGKGLIGDHQWCVGDDLAELDIVDDIVDRHVFEPEAEVVIPKDI